MKGYTYQPEKAKELVKSYIEETGNINPQLQLVLTVNI